MDYFKLADNGTSVRQEARAGLTTFLTMLYIVPVNALIMSQAGMPMDALVTATALITVFATVLNGLWSNTPVAMSVGMGLNSYFTFGLVIERHVPWQTALGVVFLSGMLFLVLSVTNFRPWVIRSVPLDLRRAISAGIGAFIAFVGLQGMKLIENSDAVLVKLGNLHDPTVLLGVLGLVLVFCFTAWRLKGAMVLAVLATAVVGWVAGLAPAPEKLVSLPAPVTPILLHLDVSSAFSLALLPVVVTFFVTDLFDSLGTLAGVGNRAGIFSESEEAGLNKLERTLEVDAAATVAGSLLGVSTTTSFVESASGVEAGGRTGLTAVFTGAFFLLTLFLLPVFSAIPPNAVYPVLVMVGVLMFSEVCRIDFTDFATLVATFLMVAMIPLTYSITNGLSIGFIAYLLVRLAKREFDQINGGVVLLAAIGLVLFFVQ